MTDIVERLRFDAARCEATFSKGVATNIEEAAADIGRLRTALADVRSYCGNAVMGRWRHDIIKIVDASQQKARENPK